MPYITREDGEHFVIPSYRDVLAAKQKTTLKKEILLLSQSYGDYITLQRKSPAQYEIAFSPDPGYLLGESVWNYFKSPLEMIYCEAIPNTTEAILVIVKGGSVYLDGSFPIESISEELVIFLTQQNNFEIYIYGDVPISKTAEPGKFSFEESSVKSFKVLDEPVFPTLPLLKIYQLQLVDVVLKEHGIGVFPIRQVVIGVLVLVLLWFGYSYLTKPAKVSVKAKPPPVNPYLGYNELLITPAPDEEILQVLNTVNTLLTMPGWLPENINYLKGTLTTTARSSGSKIQDLFYWAKQNNVKVNIEPQGVFLTIKVPVNNRPVPTKIYPLDEVVANIVDNLSTIYPGNHVTLGQFQKKGDYTQVTMTINFSNISPLVLTLIAKQLKDLPLTLQNITLSVNNGNLTGSIIMDALGS